MTIEEFWDKYTNENILDIFDISCELFSKKLPKKFIENYDVEEVVLEVKGHNETAKNFDKVIVFSDIIRSNQLDIYKELFPYFDGFLVDYYCFLQDKLEVEKAFSNFVKFPLQDYDKYLHSFKKLMFYQFSEILEQAISENFSEVEESEDLLSGAEHDLAICRFYMVSQELFEENSNGFDKENLRLKLSKYNFNLNDEYLLYYEKGILKPQTDIKALKILFTKNLNGFFTVSEGYFLRYMYKKGFEFYLSGKIWNGLVRLWKENKRPQKSIKTYFSIGKNQFDKFLAEQSGNFIYDNKPEMVSILWGSVYIYDFLKEMDLISDKVFNEFYQVSQELKGLVIGKFLPDLWDWNFVHTWEKPTSVPEIEFLEEQKIFKKSVSFTYENFKGLKDEISEELSKIGNLSKYIIKETEGARQKTFNDLIDDRIFDNVIESPEANIEEPKLKKNFTVTTEPIIAEKKVGRNEPCPCGSGKKYKKCCGT